MKVEDYHIPVLLKQSVDGLNVKPDGIYVDVTFGGGGHSREILSRLSSDGHLFSFDQDADAEQNASQGDIRLSDDPRFTFVRSNFRYLKNWMRYFGAERIDGLLADLGVSSHNFDDETSGLLFRFEATIDMRMNKRAGQTAADILNEYDEERLSDIFYLYGELKSSRKLAATIVKRRALKPFTTTGELTDAVERIMPKERAKKDMAKLFQALRIEVNHEMDALRDMLRSAVECLGEGGRLSVITYHSLEDRIVKNVMKSVNSEGKIDKDFFGRVNTPLNTIGKVIVPDKDEQLANPRSRSAKLRISEKNKI